MFQMKSTIYHFQAVFVVVQKMELQSTCAIINRECNHQTKRSGFFLKKMWGNLTDLFMYYVCLNTEKMTLISNSNWTK